MLIPINNNSKYSIVKFYYLPSIIKKSSIISFFDFYKINYIFVIIFNFVKCLSFFGFIFFIYIFIFTSIFIFTYTFTFFTFTSIFIFTLIKLMLIPINNNSKYSIVKFYYLPSIIKKSSIISFFDFYKIDYIKFSIIFNNLFDNVKSFIQHLNPSLFVYFNVLFEKFKNSERVNYLNLLSVLFLLHLGLICFSCYISIDCLELGDLEILVDFINLIFEKESSYTLGEDYSLDVYSSFFYNIFCKCSTRFTFPIVLDISSLFLSLVWVNEGSRSNINTRVFHRFELDIFFKHSNIFFRPLNHTNNTDYFFNLEEISSNCLVLVDPTYTRYQTELGHLRVGGIFIYFWSLVFNDVMFLVRIIIPSFIHIKYSPYNLKKLDGSFSKYLPLTNIYIKGVTLVTPLNLRVSGSFINLENYVLTGGETGLKSEFFSFKHSKDLFNFYDSVNSFYFSPEDLPNKGGSRGVFLVKSSLSLDHLNKRNPEFIYLTFKFFNLGNNCCNKLILGENLSIKFSTGSYIGMNNCFCSISGGVPDSFCNCLVNKSFFFSKYGVFHIKNPSYVYALPGSPCVSNQLLDLRMLTSFNKINSQIIVKEKRISLFGNPDRGVSFFFSHYNELSAHPKKFYDMAVSSCFSVWRNAPKEDIVILEKFVLVHFKGDILSFFKFFHNNYLVIQFLIDSCNITPVELEVAEYLKFLNLVRKGNFIKGLLSSGWDSGKISVFFNYFDKYYEDYLRYKELGFLSKEEIKSEFRVFFKGLNSGKFFCESKQLLSFNAKYANLEKTIFTVIYSKVLYPVLSEVNFNKLLKQDFKILRHKVILFKELGGWDIFSRRPIFICFFSYSSCLLKTLYKPKVLKAFKSSIKN